MAGRVRAFSDPLAYSDPAETGGGAGRWFTGSSADGYGCDVCHTGSAGADLMVAGLPIDGYVPGQAYEVVLTWSPAVDDVALIAEFTDEEGKGAGVLALPRPETAKPGELCAADEGGESPAQLHEAEGERNLVSLVDCGARMLRFQWTVPLTAAETLWFNAGFVTSNEDTTPSGDGVTLVHRPLGPASRTPVPSVVARGCSPLPAAGVSSWLVLWIVLAVGICRKAQRRRGGS